MSVFEDEVVTALELLTGDPNAGKPRPDEGLRATRSWNRLNRTLTVGMGRKIAEAERARRRIRGRR